MFTDKYSTLPGGSEEKLPHPRRSFSTSSLTRKKNPNHLRIKPNEEQNTPTTDLIKKISSDKLSDPLSNNSTEETSFFERKIQIIKNICLYTEIFYKKILPFDFENGISSKNLKLFNHAASEILGFKPNKTTSSLKNKTTSCTLKVQKMAGATLNYMGSRDGSSMIGAAEEKKCNRIWELLEHLHKEIQTQYYTHFLPIHFESLAKLLDLKKELEPERVEELEGKSQKECEAKNFGDYLELMDWITSIGKRIEIVDRTDSNDPSESNNTSDLFKRIIQWIENGKSKRTQIQNSYHLQGTEALELLLGAEEIMKTSESPNKSSHFPNQSIFDFSQTSPRHFDHKVQDDDPTYKEDKRMSRKRTQFFIYKPRTLEGQSHSKKNSVRIAKIPRDLNEGASKTMTISLEVEEKRCNLKAAMRTVQNQAIRMECKMIWDLKKKGVPNLPKIYEIQELDKEYIIEMELGSYDLVDYRGGEGSSAPIIPSIQLRIAYAISETLEAMEGLNFLHNDIKPRNVVLVKKEKHRNHAVVHSSINSDDSIQATEAIPPCFKDSIERILLIDFEQGEALGDKLFATTVSERGTDMYAAPEQRLPQESNEYRFGHPAQIFSLGLLIFWLKYGVDYFSTLPFIHYKGIIQVHKERINFDFMQLLEEYLKAANKDLVEVKIDGPLQEIFKKLNAEDIAQDDIECKMKLLDYFNFDMLDKIAFLSIQPNIEVRPTASQIKTFLQREMDLLSRSRSTLESKMTPQISGKMMAGSDSTVYKLPGTSTSILLTEPNDINRITTTTTTNDLMNGRSNPKIQQAAPHDHWIDVKKKRRHSARPPLTIKKNLPLPLQPDNSAVSRTREPSPKDNKGSEQSTEEV